jgi:hypothetical protein
MKVIKLEKIHNRTRNRPLKDYSGQVFGRLTAIELVSRDESSNNRHIWRFLCECGTIKDIRIPTVRNGTTKSCGCIAKETLIRRNTVHGLSRSNKKEYRSWKDMRARCFNPMDTDFHSYGGRGITVCERWNDFASFFADMGKKPTPKHTIDRVDVNGNYEPSNCRWADAETQANNKRNNRKLEHNGETKTLSQISRDNNIERRVVSYRLGVGMNIEEAVKNIDFRKRNSPIKGFSA